MAKKKDLSTVVTAFYVVVGALIVIVITAIVLFTPVGEAIAKIKG